MDKKTGNIVLYTVLGFLMPTGVPYFYLNKFKQGFLFLFIQTTYISLVLSWFYFEGITIFNDWYSRDFSNVYGESAWSDITSGIQPTMFSMDWFYIPFIFIPGIIQAVHITYLILKKKL